MSMPRPLHLLLGVLGFALASCDWMPGRPDRSHTWKPDTEITDFDALYNANCAACHSIGNGLAPSHPLNDPVYLAVASPETLKAVISNGVPGTAMPSFSIAKGGPLTDQQIEILVSTIYQKWARPQDFHGVSLPPYSAPLGDAGAGAAAFGVYCASCHGADGKGGKYGSVVDPDYLSLVSDQYLRTTVIAGRIDLGNPDWRGYVQGKPMSNQEIADVVAWLALQRPTPGAPLAPAAITGAATPTPNPNPQQ